MKTMFAAAIAAVLAGLLLLSPVTEDLANVDIAEVAQAAEVVEVASIGVYYDHFLQEERLVTDLPFFLRGYVQYGPSADSFDRMGELSRWLQSTRTRYFERSSLIWNGLSIERTWTYRGHEVRAIFVQYGLVDGEVVCNYPDGVLYLAAESPFYPGVEAALRAGELGREEFLAERRRLSWEEFGKVEDLLYGSLEQAVDWLWKDLGPLQEELVAMASEQLGVQSIFDKVPFEVDPPLTVGDILGVPYLSKEQILPDVIYYGPLAGAAAWMSVGSNIWLHPGYGKAERRMAIHEQWLGYDWIRGCPQIVRHELTHAWQSTPLGWYYDVELFNEMYTHCIDVDELDFLSHPYLRRIRSIALRYWSFDAYDAYQSLMEFRVGGVTQVSREKYNEMAELVHVISAELRKNAMDFYRAFYSDPLFYIALQEVCRDSQMAVDLLYAQIYEPTCLGGAEETQRWQEAHAEEIAQLGKRALADVKAQKEDEAMMWSMSALSIWQGLPDEIRVQLAQAYEQGGMEAVAALLRGESQ